MGKALSAILAAAVLIGALGGCATIRPPGNAAKEERTTTVTGYCPCKKCCKWRRTWYGRAVVASGPHEGERKRVGMTASGAKAHIGTIAADTTRYPFGTVMFVPGYGYGRVEDRGSAIQGEHIDVFFKHHNDALQWGKQTLPVTVWLPPGTR